MFLLWIIILYIKAKKIKKLTGKSNILFNVPYSCDLNPIENIFGIVKKKYRLINSDDGKNIEIIILNSFYYLSNIISLHYIPIIFILNP